MKKILGVLSVVVIVIAALYISGLNVFTYKNGPAIMPIGSATAPTLIKTAVNGSASVSGATSTVILAKNTARQYAMLTNNSANVIYVSLGSAATTSTGFRLEANGGRYEINQNNLFIGQINGMASSTTSAVLTIEE